MTCTACGEHPKENTARDFPKAVIEIDNPEQINLFRKVVIPTSMGDDTTIPPAIGKYRNVLLVYEVNNHAYLYSSDGIPTLLTSDVAQELETKIDTVAHNLSIETTTRENADIALQQQLNNKVDASSLSTVATSGNYNDLDNKPTIGNATLTIQKNSSSVGTFTANATSNKSINVTVPTKTSDLTNTGSDNTSTYVEADDLATVATTGSYSDLLNKPVVDNALSTSSSNSVANSAVSTALDTNLVTGISLDSTPSTTTVQINGAKKNLYSSSTSTENVVLPVASTTQAGVMNSSTFDAVTTNTNNINAIMNGAVAVTGLPASPSQSDLTTAWQTETGLTTLINRASVYDVTNDKVWTYYTNDTTWHAASNTSQVTINTFTNSSEGTIKGSTNTGQVFAESDGTGSINGWDTLSNSVSTNTGNISSLQTAVAGKQNALTAGSNISISGNTISATNTTYTAGSGLSLTGTAFSVDTSTIAQKSEIPTKTSDLTNNGANNTSTYVEADDLATVATSGSYSDLLNKPTIPTVNNATLTIQQNGTNVATFTANSSTDTTANITSPNITMTNIDPGEGSALTANNFVGVYGLDPIILDYSTSEVNTGIKWIDGKTIYKKTVASGNLPSAGGQLLIPHGITNIDKVIKIEGTYNDSNVNQATFPINSPSTANDNSPAIRTIVLGSNIQISTGSANRSSLSGYVTLYYTKSS